MRLPLGLVRLETPEPIALGTTLVLQVLNISLPEVAPAAATDEGAAPSMVLSLTHEWPALKEALEVVQSVNPPAAQRLLTNTIPAANAQIPSSVLLFLAALRLGDVAGWLGREAAQTLERSGRGALLRRLADDFARLGQFADERYTEDWRTFILPFSDGHHLHQVRILARQYGRQNDEDNDEKTGTRFVVDLDLSRLGRLQLDGLVRQEQFDLVVRSQEPLANEIQRDISAIFRSGIAASGLMGSVAFRAGATFHLSAMDEVARRDLSTGGLVV